MLKLKRLRLKAIGRFVEEQSIDIEELGNLVQVDGENQNTGGSSGSGKSTVFNALDFLLGLNDLPTTVLQSRLTKDKMAIEGDFDWDGKQLTISRGAKLSVTIDGETVIGSAALAEEKIDEILGMPRDFFRKILHKRQKEGGFFLDLGPKKTYEFFTDVLKLEQAKKNAEKIENKLKSLEIDKNNLENKVLSAQSSLKATQDSILALGLPPIRDIHKEVILELKTKSDASKASLAKIIEDHKTQNSILDAEKPSLIPTPALESAEQLPQPQLLDTDLGNASTISLLEAKLGSTNKEISDLKEQEAFRVKQLNEKIQSQKMTVMALEHKCLAANSAKNEAVKVAGDIKKIRDAICPTCEQSWITETAKAKENELMAKLAEYKKQIADGANAEQIIAEIKADILRMEVDKAPQITEKLMDLNVDLETYQKELSFEKNKADEHKRTVTSKNMQMLADHATRQKHLNFEVSVRNQAVISDIEVKNKVTQNMYQTKVSAVREMQGRELEQARGQADVDSRALDAAVSKLRAYEEARQRYESALDSMKQKEVDYFAEIDAHDHSLRQVSEDYFTTLELKKAVKTYISCSFDDALESIGDNATKIIRCIPTMSNATIQFEGQKETKDGKVKEEVNAVISMDGEIGIPIKSLSGGERSAVDLAVDLAVIDFIESETGKGIDVFILDEPFTGLDTVGIEMALEVLKNSNTNKKLIIVDHNPEVKQMVSNRIVVVRDGLTSTISSQET